MLYSRRRRTMLRTRLDWDDYFMIQALWAKVRSPDSSTQHGCVLVDKCGRLIGQGYNGYPRNIDDSKMPQARPEKYPPILHSEENAILNSTGDLWNATAYVTGPPCIHCWAHIIQSGIKRVVYGPIVTSSKGLYSDIQPQVIQDMLENQNIEVIRWTPNNCNLIQEELELIAQLVMTTAF